MLKPPGKSTGGMCHGKWTKKTKKRTITCQAARWAASKVSRGRIQPYIGVDMVPRSRSNAQSNAPLGNAERKGKKNKKKTTLPRAGITLFTEYQLREQKRIILIKVSPRSDRFPGWSTLAMKLLFRCSLAFVSRLIANEKGHVRC